jgi:hypothetical protein
MTELTLMSLSAFHALPTDKGTPRHMVLGLRSWPVPKPNGVVRVTFVLLSGGIGDYAVYIGAGGDDWVADHGDKAPWEVALLAFPGIERERYRG